MSYSADMEVSDPKSTTEDDSYVAFARRVVRGLGRRAASNLDILYELEILRQLADNQMHAAVHQLRNDPDAPASWSEIGAQLGISRQAAQRRFGGDGDGVREAGGQPGELR